MNNPMMMICSFISLVIIMVALKRSKKPISQTHSITIYGRKSCPYCDNAVRLVKRNPKLKLKEFKTVRNSDHLQNVKTKIKTRKKIPDTIPIVLEDGKYIGGFSELEKKYF